MTANEVRESFKKFFEGKGHKTRGKDFLIAGFAFALGETTRETTCSTVLLTIIIN